MISELSLRNFKAFKSIDLPIAELTILSGLNGSGKSSVMQAIAALRQSNDTRFLQDDGGLLLNGELVSLGTGKDVLFEHAEHPRVSISIRDGMGRWGVTSRWDFSYTERANLLPTESAPSVDFVNAPLSGGFQFLSADRAAPAVMFPKSYTDAIRRRFLGIRGQYSVYYLAVCQDEVVPERRVRNSSKGTQLLSQVESWLDSLSPGVGVLAREVVGADLAQLSFVYGGKAGIESSNEYRPTNVGFGLTYVLPVVVACLSAKPGEFLMIENPEAHLHPQGQSLMGELLARTAADGVQIMVETHSDHLINGIRRSIKRRVLPPSATAFHFFRREGGGLGTTFETPVVSEDGRFDRWPEGFFDEWDKAVLELI